MEGDPKFEASQVLPDFAFARYAELLGLRGILVDDPAKIGAAWDAALREERPAVLEFITDPEVPPLPPHITLKQAQGFASAILKRDPEGGCDDPRFARADRRYVSASSKRAMIERTPIESVGVAAYRIPAEKAGALDSVLVLSVGLPVLKKAENLRIWLKSMR